VTLLDRLATAQSLPPAAGHHIPEGHGLMLVCRIFLLSAQKAKGGKGNANEQKSSG
jgi:hypothetical protein